MPEPFFQPALKPDIGVADFDALHDNLPAWRGVIESLAAEHSAEPVVQMEAGTVLVALLGSTLAIKLYPPFLRDHFNFECAMLGRLGERSGEHSGGRSSGRLQVPTPRLLKTGEREGWPWLLMSQLHGEPLTAVWPKLDEPAKCALLSTLGALAAEVHALPVGDMARHAPPWADFLAGQRARCHGRQQRTGLPPHLLLQLDSFLLGDLPVGPDVILTGEYTPMNLLAQHGRLSGMFDFGDGLVGPREYDWLGPMAFLAAGHAGRCSAFMDGYGAATGAATGATTGATTGAIFGAAERLALLRLLLLHRYSNLSAQLAVPGWQQAPSFEALAGLIWP